MLGLLVLITGNTYQTSSHAFEQLVRMYICVCLCDVYVHMHACTCIMCHSVPIV